MPKNRVLFQNWRFTVILLLASTSLAATRASAQTTSEDHAASATGQLSFQLKAQSNLVLVRVVVRDAQGKPVKGLRKEDFQIFDRGKEQAISHFEREGSTLPPPISAEANSPGQASPPPPAAMPGRFLLLYFDTLNTSDADLIYARKAAERYIASNLQPADRIALFTSEKMLSDFTANTHQLESALTELRSSARSLNHIHECPDLSDYQALEISRQENPEGSDAWEIALANQGAHCPVHGGGLAGGSPNGSVGDSPAAAMIRMHARNVLMQANMQARSNLQALENAVKYTAQMLGQRTVILVSPGFLTQTEQYPLDRLIDRAVAAQVVISSLDPRGLALPMVATNAAQEDIPGHPGTLERLQNARELIAGDVLAEVAQGTGGLYFHNNNDVQAGMVKLAGTPTYYLLAFTPTNLKQDGGFHALKVKLAEQHKGFDIQARRGYFAPKNQAQAAAEAREQAASETQAKEEQQMREAMFSKTDSQQLQIGLGGKISEGHGGNRKLSLVTHLDARPLHFRKDGAHNVNTLTFVFAAFDDKNNLVVARQELAHLSLLDSELPGLLKAGVTFGMDFDLKPGTYRIREVVTESEDHRFSARSTTINIP